MNSVDVKTKQERIVIFYSSDKSLDDDDTDDEPLYQRYSRKRMAVKGEIRRKMSCTL